MSARLAMAVDTRRCVGCNACVIACKTENALPEGCFRDWIAEEVSGTFPDLTMQIRSERCNHCEVAPCVSACPTGASHVGDGGAILVTAGKCTGCKACIASCPYGARSLHPAGHVDKCTFCLHRVLAGKQPACTEICPTRALTFGDLHDPASPVARLLARRRHLVLQPGAGTSPHVFYLV
jgi:Fe-S-cluster-containing dehydrogenase component